MKRYKAILFAFLVCLSACSKTSEDVVFIRIQNTTAQKFTEVFTNNKSFANVNASAATSYQTFDKVSDLPFVRIITKNNDTAYAGAIYIDPPIYYLANGKYTLQIFNDATAFYGYNCRYIKD